MFIILTEMIFANGWKSKNKQGDKFILKIRIGLVTLLDFYYDHSKKLFGFMIMNLGFKNANKQKK